VKYPLAIIAFIYVVSLVGVSAQTINWSGEVVEPPQVFINRAGDPLTDQFTFALGSFGTEFFPTIENYQQWAENFKIFDTAVYNAIDGFFMSEASLTEGRTSDSTSSLVNLSDQFMPGEKAYIWIFDTQDTQGSFDWALVSAVDWLFPESGVECCDDGVLYWSLSDILNSGPGDGPVIGGVNQERGPGYYDDISSTTFTIQTATIPEPSAFILVVVAGAVGLLRRRRVGV